MKKIFYIVLVCVLCGCEDRLEEIHRYARFYSLTKDYPIYLDASEIVVDIEVTKPVQPQAPFKIVSNGSYLFVGEKMKGIHVYEINGNPLCFIECKHLKAFDVAKNLLYCNNFVDLLVVDVEQPQQATIKQRVKEYFNNYKENNLNLSVTTQAATGKKLYVIGYKQVVITGTETHKDPPPDFSEYDEIYGNLIVKEIPESLRVDKPCVGIANIEGDIFTLGFDFIVQCSYESGVLQFFKPAMENPVPNTSYYRTMPYTGFHYKDGMTYLMIQYGFAYWGYNASWGRYWSYPNVSHTLLDITPLKKWESGHVILSDLYVEVTTFMMGSFNHYYAPSQGATSMININDTILALGAQLALYQFIIKGYDYNSSSLELWLNYPNISGTSMLKEGNNLIVAGKQGISFYDISDLRKIKKR